MKIDYELKDCTFVPNINKYNESKIDKNSQLNKEYCDFDIG